MEINIQPMIEILFVHFTHLDRKQGHHHEQKNEANEMFGHFSN